MLFTEIIDFYCHIKNTNLLSEQNIRYFNDRTGGA